MMGLPAEDGLSSVFAALADPTRRDMVARLAEGDATVNELAEPYDMVSRPSPVTARCWKPPVSYAAFPEAQRRRPPGGRCST
ncbi:MAG: hypothetical protein R2705_19680 [Ilumatobacteraceae bacterium]